MAKLRRAGWGASRLLSHKVTPEGCRIARARRAGCDSDRTRTHDHDRDHDGLLQFGKSIISGAETRICGLLTICNSVISSGEARFCCYFTI